MLNMAIQYEVANISKTQCPHLTWHSLILKGASLLHNSFLELVRMIKYRVSIEE